MVEEANVIINGKRLNIGESMTLRVALNNFLIDLGTYDDGSEIWKLYESAAKQILKLMMEK